MTIDYAQPTSFTLERPNSLPLSFEGWELASESSRYSPRRARKGDRTKVRPANPPDRWTEVRIYLTLTGLWVVEYLGCTVVPGEVTIRRVEVCEEPDEVLNALRHGGSGKIPGVSAKALTAAAENDGRLTPALQEHI